LAMQWLLELMQVLELAKAQQMVQEWRHEG
jgi:hypothetical protein